MKICLDEVTAFSSFENRYRLVRALSLLSCIDETFQVSLVVRIVLLLGRQDADILVLCLWPQVVFHKKESISHCNGRFSS